jgi:ferritin heavy chain
MAKRGGIVHYEAIPKPPEYATETTTALGILQASLDLEHTVNAKLLKLHQLAEEHEDAQLEDFLEQHFLDEQVESIKQIADLVTQLERAGPEGLGLFLFDQRMPEAL